MSITPRSYKSADEIAIGDVVVMNGDDINAFASTIVARIQDGNAYLVRPMCHADETGGVWTHEERYSVSLESLFKNFRVYVTGASGRKDNRIVKSI